LQRYTDICRVKNRKKILVAPLNWGLGHAARCVPIINALESQGFEVLLASDGAALALLRKEFPHLETVALPSYDITYAAKASDFKRKMIAHLPKMYKTIRAEHRLLKKLIIDKKIDGVISDNRLGLYSKNIPSVCITHQLQVLSGKTTKWSTLIHTQFLKKFTECWVPDVPGDKNLSGILGHPARKGKNVKYIGPLSRMCAENAIKNYKAIAILSGPEPQRAILEAILIKELKKYNGSVLLVQGVMQATKTSRQKGNIEIVNFLTSTELEDAINESDFVIARSGYTTIMDLAVMQKKAFFIPTPGQFEQEYLARRLREQGIAPFAEQDTFRVKDLAKMSVYRGFKEVAQVGLSENLFGLFKSEGKLRPYSYFTLNIDSLIVSFNNMFNNRKAES